MRKLLLEKLDDRLCMAFGDVVTDFADAGQYSVSYAEIDRRWSPIAATFPQSNGYLRVAYSTAGSGTIFTLAKVDMQGLPDGSFGTNGVVQFIDPSLPEAGISNVQSLSSGGILLRIGSQAARAVVKLHADGSFDTSFGTSGFLRERVSDFREGGSDIAIDPFDGFFLVRSSPQNFNTVVTHYSSNGQLDTAFGNSGSVELPSLFNIETVVDSAGKLTVVGWKQGSLAAYRFEPDGSSDASFGTGGSAVLQNVGAFSRYQFVGADNQLLLSRALFVDGVYSISLARYSSDLEIDTSFGAQGTALIQFETASFNPSVLEVLQDTSGLWILSSTYDYPLQRQTLRIQKLSLDGQVDQNFGTNGVVKHQVDKLHQSLKIELDGRGGAFWSGSFNPLNNANFITDSFIIHTLADGQLDQSWGTNGLMVAKYTPKSQTIDSLQLDALSGGRMRIKSGWPRYGDIPANIGRADTLDRAGKIVSTADFGLPETQLSIISVTAADGGWFMARLTAGPAIEISKFATDGTLDATFGNQGLMQIPTERMDHFFMRSGRDGSIAIAAGSYATTADPQASQGVAVIIRLNADGSPDTNFGPGGVKRLYEKAGKVADVMVDPLLGTLLVIDPDAGLQLQLFRADGSVETEFGNNGIQTLSGLKSYRSGAIDEVGRILVVTQQEFQGQAYHLYQFDTRGQTVTGFGNAGRVNLPMDFNETLDAVSLSLRQGVIAVAAAHGPIDNVVRLAAYDYAGKPLTELDTDGIRDYDLSDDGVRMSDLAFADDGSLWMATSQRHGFSQIGSVIKLEGSQAATNHNWKSALDTNNDQHVTALDALLVISALNGLQLSSDMLLDVNADTLVTALDALTIINHLNQTTARASDRLPAGAEGEPSPVPARATTTITLETLGDVDQLSKRRRLA